MNLGWGMLLRALSFAAVVGLLWTGIGFLSFSLYVVLLPSFGAGGAALCAALACIVTGGLLLTALILHVPQPRAPHLPAETAVVQGGTIVKALSELAEDHPLIAVFCAAILGATNDRSGAKRH